MKKIVMNAKIDPKIVMDQVYSPATESNGIIDG